jgi:tetratricopeptide (TPR) repeat protein
MAYIRKRGNQLALVQGERDPETRKVCQRVLFTFYSKKEAVAALDDTQGSFLQSLLELEYPEIRFPWKRIWWELARNLDALPEDYEYREAEIVKRFRTDLCAFTRQLVLNEPQWLFFSAELLQQHRYELEYLIELIRWRLKLCDTKPDEFNRDNEFYWRWRLRGREVPVDTEEEMSELYKEGDLDRAEAILHLLVDSFENDAESHNYLGLIALDRGKLDEAERHFRKMMDLSRKRLPRRLTPRIFKNNNHGKPYRRGLSNLLITLNRLGRYEEALRLADQLEHVCGDLAGAECHRAGIHLNRGALEEAVAGDEFRCGHGILRVGMHGRKRCRFSAWCVQPSGRRSIDYRPARESPKNQGRISRPAGGCLLLSGSCRTYGSERNAGKALLRASNCQSQIWSAFGRN